MKAEEKRLQEIEDWISIHSTNRIIAQKIYGLEKENAELKAAIKKGIIRSIEDDGSLTIYWNDLTENEQDLLTETITDK